jgi:hypothetical protein
LTNLILKKLNLKTYKNRWIQGEKHLEEAETRRIVVEDEPMELLSEGAFG